MLEFTATVDLAHSEIKAKYHDKIIYEYSLKQFRKDGFSKEVNVTTADDEPINRAFQAVLLSQYRLKIAAKNGLRIKPVILLKSKNIAPSKEFREEFHNFIENLEPKHLEEAKARLSIPTYTKIFKYFEDNQITFENLITELKGDFSREKTLDINDTKELEANQIKVNSLEDKNNEIRVVFAVDKLNEGWDVLNLFDIVRLYDTRDSSGGKIGKTTMSEAQLIGRGARYYPFQTNAEQELYKRKYDSDLENELKILEELHYHSPSIPKYIDEIKSALRQTGILEDERIEKHMKVKDSFKKTEFWKNGLIFVNKQRKTDKSEFGSLADYSINGNFKYELKTGEIASSGLFNDQKEDGKKRKIVSKSISLKDFDKSIIRFALDGLEFYNFENISKYFPIMNSVQYFVEREETIAGVAVEVTGVEEQIDNLSTTQKLDIVFYVLGEIEQSIKSKSYEFEGTKEFKPLQISNVLIDKVLKFAKDNSDDKETGKGMQESREVYFNRIDLTNKDWFVYNDCFGSSEEKFFIKYVHDNEEKIKNIYEEFFLIRNEKLFKIYSFEGGQAFEPDFILFLKKRSDGKELIYQIFVEPKGAHLKDKDSWKEKFLLELKEQATIGFEFPSRKYNIFGLPFFNEEHKTDFNLACKELLSV